MIIYTKTHDSLLIFNGLDDDASGMFKMERWKYRDFYDQ